MNDSTDTLTGINKEMICKGVDRARETKKGRQSTQEPSPHQPEEGRGRMVTRIWRAAAIGEVLQMGALVGHTAAPNPSPTEACEINTPISLCSCLPNS